MSQYRQPSPFDPFALDDSGRVSAQQQPVPTTNYSDKSPPATDGEALHRASPYDPFAVDDSVQYHDGGGGGGDDVGVGGEESAAAEPHLGPRSAAPLQPPALGTTKRISSGMSVSSASSQISALPPKMIVRLLIHEEASSSKKSDEANDSASRLFVEGRIQAHVHSSDATKNLPFFVKLSGSVLPQTSLKVDEGFATPVPPTDDGRPIILPGNPDDGFDDGPYMLCRVDIPKAELSNVDVVTYKLSEEIMHMPLLVQKKVSLSGTLCKIAVQIRSNLNNAGNLTQFTIAVAVPQSIDGNTVNITRGEGAWDGLKRVIKWTLEDLPKGESFMVCAEADLFDDQAPVPDLPVLLRCTSVKDSLSSVQVDALEADGFPATVVVNRVHSFCLLHRVT